MKTANDCICAWINLYSYEKDRRIALETALKNLQREKEIMQRNYEKRIESLCKYSEKLILQTYRDTLEISQNLEVEK